ncbi:MAG: acyltransferase [Lachnospiraceae bacterium]|nr:acyltransferase [Lachnospiraceae bacterium]
MKDCKRDHLYYIDVLRIASVVAVILAHAHLEYVYYMYWSVLVFTAISGAMMLGRENIDMRRLYTHSICRIVTAFVFWSAVYSLLQNLLLPLLDGNPISVKLIITSLVEGQYHLWYCYMITGLFILAPCFKAVIDKDIHLGLYFCLVAFVFSIIIPSFQNIDILKWTATPTGNIGLEGLRFSFYFVMGYYLVNYDFSASFRKIIYIAGAIFLIPFIAFPNTAFFNVYEAVVAIAIFVAARYLIDLKSVRLKKAVSTLADSVFSVYLIHDIFNIVYGRIFGREHSPAYDIGKFCFTLILSFAAGLLIRKCKRVSSYIS